MLAPGKRLAVFSIRSGKTGTVWVRAGSAYVNKDSSLNLVLDVLPIDGRLHVREAYERKDAVSSEANRFASPEGLETAAVGGHS